MSAAMFHILLAGNDLHLLDTRAEILKRDGLRVSCCRTDETAGVLGAKKIALLVLCHTMTDGEVERIVKSTREQHVGTMLLMVSAISDGGYSYATECDAVVTGEPALLIRCVREMLQPGRR